MASRCRPVRTWVCLCGLTFGDVPVLRRSGCGDSTHARPGDTCNVGGLNVALGRAR